MKSLLLTSSLVRRATWTTQPPLRGAQQPMRCLVNFKIRKRGGGVAGAQGRKADHLFVQKKEAREIKRVAAPFFAEKARTLIERLASGSEPLQDANDDLIVTRSDDGFSFEIDHGGDLFSISVDETSQTLFVRTPKTVASASFAGGGGELSKAVLKAPWSHKEKRERKRLKERD